MSFLDTIKKSVLEGFDTTLAPSDILLGLTVAVAAALFILYIYRTTMRQVAFNRSYCVSVLLVTVISAMMVLTITSNLALSLGMVGALSIVRFRTAIKDPSDTAFLFWAVAAGITSGAGFYLLTLVGCLFVGLVCVLATVLFDQVEKPYLLIVRADSPEALNAVEQALTEKSLRFSLSSVVENGQYAEAVYESTLTDAATLAALRALPGVTSAALIDCRKT